MDYVREVTTPNVFQWDPDDQLSRQWTLQTGDRRRNCRPFVIALWYFLRMNANFAPLRQRGFGAPLSRRQPRQMKCSLNPDGVFLSNGPGDPEALPYVQESVRGLIGRKPIFEFVSGTSAWLCSTVGGLSN